MLSAPAAVQLAPIAHRLEFPAGSAGRVLDERYAVAVCYLRKSRQVAWHAHLVDHQDSTRARSHGLNTRSGSILYVLGSISTKMGFGPQYRMLLAVAIKEGLAVITSSSVPTPTAISAK